MKLADFNKALNAFRKRLLRNGTWDDGAIEFRVDDPDWDWMTFLATVRVNNIGENVIIGASLDTKADKIRLHNWEGAYEKEPWKKYNVL